MGLLDGLLGGVLGAGAQQMPNPLVATALQVIQQNGGLPGIISKFQHGGLADHVGSWLGTGANLPITGSQLQEVLGTGAIGQIAQQLGLSHSDASGGLAQVLEIVADEELLAARLQGEPSLTHVAVGDNPTSPPSVVTPAELELVSPPPATATNVDSDLRFTGSRQGVDLVVKVHTLLLANALPSTSFTPVVTVAV